MSTSIRISEETKQKLEAVKRDDETFDELLDRLAVTRTPDDVEAMAGFAEEGIEKQMKKTHDELSESLEENSPR
jgi:predicted CopG family antitoxin